jgi:hypothetical protein
VEVGALLSPQLLCLDGWGRPRMTCIKPSLSRCELRQSYPSYEPSEVPPES